MWLAAAIPAAAAHAWTVVPTETECSSEVPASVTTATQYLGPGMRSVAALMSSRTGVTPSVPMISKEEMRAPTQWEISMTSWPERPGKKYLLPPDMPTTSWGSTGPTTRFTSASTAILLTITCMGTSSRRPPE